MKLWDKTQTPIGGWSFHDPTFDRRISSDVDFDDLYRKARSWYISNGYEIPENLKAFIEDSICQSQPPGKCYYEKVLGDGIAFVVHKAAHAVDKVLKTNLEQTARQCGGCGKRRIALNKASR